MNKHGFDTVIVRFGGEIGIKAEWTRRLYERRLLNNIKAVLKHNSIGHSRFIRTFGRLYIKTEEAETVAEKLRKVFGISSVSPAFETTSNMNDIVDVSLKTVRLKFSKGRSFAVHCRRVGKHSYSSQDVCRTVGEQILTRLPESKLHVDLTNPKQTLTVEIREQKAYISTDTIKTAGGLPLGTQSKTVCLLKGDASSVIACWMTMKRGSPPIIVHLKNGQLSRAVKKAVGKLNEWAIGFPTTLRTIEYDTTVHRFLNKHPSELHRLLCKRLLLRAAQSIAEKEHAEAIITGDTLDPNQNQTPHTLRVQDEAADNYPVLRPLLGLSPEEIKKLAQQLNLETGIAQKETEPHKPTTIKIALREIRQIESKINIDRTIENITNSITITKLNTQEVHEHHDKQNIERLSPT